MITIISTTSASAKAVTKLDKNKYQLLLLFGDYIEPRYYKEYSTHIIGRKTLGCKGTGGDMELGKKAMEESLNDVLSLIKGEEVVVVCYSGGGMAGGITTLVESLLKQNKKVSVITSIPSKIEGPNRLDKSKIIIDDLNSLSADINTIVYDNVLENAIEKYGKEKITLLQFFKICDEIAYNKILEIIEND